MNTLYSRLASRLDTLEGKLTQLDSRVETLDSRLAQLDSRVDELTARVHENSETPQMNELSSNLDGQQSQLDGLSVLLDHVDTRLDTQRSQLDVLTNISNSERSRLVSTAASQQTQIDELKLTSNLDGQQSQLDGLVVRLDHVDTRLDTQRSQLDVLTNISNSERSRLASTPTSQQTQIDELKHRLAQVELGKDEGDEAQPHTAQVEEGSEEPQPEPELIQQPEPIPRGCSELPTGSASGIHQVQLRSDPFRPPITAVCDMDTDSGNWTVFQRRGINRPRQNFFLRWSDYKEGFGDLTGEFWWGLENLWLMTSGRDREYELRIDLEDFGGAKAHAVYRGFRISSEDEGYKLTVTSYTGTAGDGLRAGVNRKFSTRDRDQDTRSRGSCAKRHGGAWWYGGCGDSSLNGRRHRSRRGGFDIKGIWWFPWKRYDSLKRTEMKIRRV